MNGQSVLAEALRPGDQILLPPATVKTVKVENTHVHIEVEEGYPCGYRLGSNVRIAQRED